MHPKPAHRELHDRRASSFGAVAAGYAEHRPGYPTEAVAWALHPAPGREVLDLAAGTGKVTEVLVRVGADVVAVEPDAGMLAELARRFPQVRTLAGSAESVPLDEGAVDAVVVGQAFHWFDPDAALPEIARVLRPGGVLAVLGNAEDEAVDWVAGLVALGRSVRSADLVSLGRGYAAVPPHPAFSEPEQRRFGWRWPRTIESLLHTIGTHSWVLVSPPEQRESALAALRDYLVEQHPAGAFELPMSTTVVRLLRG